MARRIAFALAAASLVLSSASAGAAPAQMASDSGARAFAIQVAVPGQGSGSSASVSAPPDAVSVGGGFAFPGDGSIVSASSVTAGSFATPGSSATASASAEVSGLSLFKGEVTVSSVIARARASANSRTASADVAGSSVSGMTVAGQGAGTGAGSRVSLGDWGYAVVQTQGTSVDTASKAARGYVTALHVRVTADHNGIPAGTEVMVGYAEASAKAAPPKTPAFRKRTAEPKPNRGPATTKKKVRGPGIGPEIPPLIRRPPPPVTPALTAGRYVFPVYGPSSYSDTFGAPRGTIASGWHHGQDIFAPLGAPILAVADGTVFSVGWNKVGGYRFWLRDQEGNEFYYAHLSAYSPAAVNGTEVKAGTVIGFVGTTGDARGTPPHLHFEIHPVGYLHLGYDGAVNPMTYLDAWKRLEDIEFAAVAGWAPPVAPSSRAPKPGAILLSSTDIASADGLEPGALRRVLDEADEGSSLEDAP